MSNANGVLKVVKDSHKEKYDAVWLQTQVAKLYGKRIIKRQADIAERTGYHKSNVSNYMNPDSGIPPSKYFIEAFLDKFGKYLKDDSAEEIKRLKEENRELKAALKDARDLNELLRGKK